MNLKESLELLSKISVENKELIKNEESTKQFLILPLLQGLGYDTYSPQEVTPEFTADFHKKNEKVDYAISINGEPKIFLEAKSMDKSIVKNTPQLSRYFSTFPTVKLGILTNGIEYRFFTDLNNTNIMDTQPFFTFNIQEYTEEDYDNLVKFSKNIYDEETVKKLAESLIYFQSFKSVIKEIFENPSDDFIRFVVKEKFKFKVTQQFINTSRPLIQKSIQEAVTELIAEKFNIDVYQPTTELSPTTETLVVEKKKSPYSEEDIISLNQTEIFEDINIVIPNSENYKKLIKLSSEEYSVEKGNPNSLFFISSIVMQGASTTGYLIGQYTNQKEDIKLYTVKSNEIEGFLNENPTVKEQGFINAKLQSRINKTNEERIYYLKNNIPGLAFKDIPNLISTFDKASKFFI